MKSSIKFTSFLLLGMYLFSSCTLIFVPKHQKGIEITTGNKDAEVYVDKVQEGKGSKVIIKKTKKTGMKQIVVRVPDHKDYHSVMVPTKRDPVFWAVLPLDLTNPYGWYAAAAKTAKKYKYDKTFSAKNLHKLPIKTDDQKHIRYIATQLKIKNIDTDLQTYQIKYSKDLQADFKKAENKKIELDQKTLSKLEKNKKKTLDDGEKQINYDDSYFTEGILKTLKETGYTDTSRKILTNNSNVLGLEAIIVAGKSYQASKIIYSGASTLFMIKLDIDWIIKDQYNQIIDSIRISEMSDQFVLSYFSTNQYKDALSDAVNKSFLALNKNSKYQQHLKIDTSKSKTLDYIVLDRPKSVVKNAKDALTAAVAIKYTDNSGHGSGFAITNDGYILTNFHVIAGERAGVFKDFVAVMPNGTEVKAEIVRADPISDIALLKVNETFEKSFVIPTSKSYELLEDVYTVGTPASMDLGNTITIGILSNERKNDGIDVLQLNMGINSGNSGGPVFSKQNGNLYGVITSKLVGRFTEGVTFAVPAHILSSTLFLKYDK